MTVTTHGYRDWGRIVQQADERFVNEVDSFVGLAGTIIFEGFVGTRPYLGISGVATTFAVQVNLTWAMDAAFAQVVDIDSFDVPNGYIMPLSVPVAAPYLRVTVLGSAANAVYSLDVFTIASPRWSHGTGNRDPVLIEEAGTGVGAGANLTRNANHLFVGEVLAWVQTDAAAWQMNVRAVSFGGGIRELCIFDQLSGYGAKGHQVRLFLPGRGARMVFTNTSGVSVTARFGLLARPLMPGL